MHLTELNFLHGPSPEIKMASDRRHGFNVPLVVILVFCESRLRIMTGDVGRESSRGKKLVVIEWERSLQTRFTIFCIDESTMQLGFVFIRRPLQLRSAMTLTFNGRFSVMNPAFLNSAFTSPDTAG